MNFINDFAGFCSFFRSIAESSTYFNFFEQGGTEKIVSERLVNDTRSRITYPLLFLEWPEIPISDFGSSSPMIDFRTGIVILDQCPKDDWEKQDIIMNQTYLATIQVLAKIQESTKGLNKRFFSIDLSKVSIMPLDSLLIDSAYGWRMEFGVTSPLSTCINSTYWK